MLYCSHHRRVVVAGVFLVLILALRDPLACVNLVATMILTYAFALGATHLVFVYPTWFGAPPAMLKGWLDRVWVAGVAFDRVPGSNRPRARLMHIRRLSVVTTYGSSRWVNALEGEPGKRLVKRWLRVLCHPLARTRWIALYGLDRADDAARRAFLDRVGRAFR